MSREKLEGRLDFCEDDAGEISQEQINKVADNYDSDDKALALLEWNPAQEGAITILKEVLEFCRKLEGVDVVMMEGATLNLSNIRLFADAAAKLSAERDIEQGYA